jgi:putative Holliday junction resolvase
VLPWRRPAKLPLPASMPSESGARGRPGRVLGLDHGSRRVGVAVSDALRMTAQPLEVVSRTGAVARVAEIVAEYEIEEIVVGLPTSLNGTEGPPAAAARGFGEEITLATGIAVHYVDERFTTVTAEKAMLEAGAKRQVRRDRLDKVAAAIILQAFLDRSQ